MAALGHWLLLILEEQGLAVHWEMTMAERYPRPARGQDVFPARMIPWAQDGGVGVGGNKELAQAILETEKPSPQIQGQPSRGLRRSVCSSSLSHDRLSVDVNCMSEWDSPISSCPTGGPRQDP